MNQNLIKDLICSSCGKAYPADRLQSYSECCKKPLLANYQLVKQSRDIINVNDHTMWRYIQLLPLNDVENKVSLGEGLTPLLSMKNLAAQKNMNALLLKDESYNPTGSFKSRGISMAVSKAMELGLKKLIMPTAGNAGVALAAYCARAQMQCTVIMPELTPDVYKNECRMYGAELIVVNGLIDQCGKEAERLNRDKEFFDVSTLKEPYRLEGKKTMGYEIAEQLNWKLPDVIIYPAGGGTGMIGIWKAFREMLQLGWITEPLPQMIAVQSENCAPLDASLRDPQSWKKNFTASPTIAYGLAVPYPFGLDLMHKVIHESLGQVITVSDQEIRNGIKEVARNEGIWLSPEGSATWVALNLLLRKNSIRADQKVLLLNTGSGYKFSEA